MAAWHVAGTQTIRHYAKVCGAECCKPLTIHVATPSAKPQTRQGRCESKFIYSYTGESFFFERHTQGTWVIETQMRKLYVIFDVVRSGRPFGVVK